MNQKISLFVILLGGVFILSFTECNRIDDDSDEGPGSDFNFEFFLDAALQTASNPRAILLTNDQGEILFSTVQTDLATLSPFYGAYIPPGERVHLTYVEQFTLPANLGSGTYFRAQTLLDVQSSVKLYAPDVLSFADISVTEVRIGGVDSLGDVRIDTYNNHNIGVFHNGDELRLLFDRFEDVAPYVLVKANGEEQFRYFYAASLGNQFQVDYSSLPSQLDSAIINLPETNQWYGSIQAEISGSSTHLKLFSRSNTPDLQAYDRVVVYYPAALELSRYEYELIGRQPHYQLDLTLSDLMTQILAPDFDFGAELTMGNFRIPSGSQANLFYLNYRYPSDAVHQITGPVFSSWQIAGYSVFDEMITLPEWSEEIRAALPSLQDGSQPVEVDLELGSVTRPISAADWREGNRVFYVPWKRQQGLLTRRETNSL